MARTWNLSVKWVKAHSGLHFNEQADRLADLGRLGNSVHWIALMQSDYDEFGGWDPDEDFS